jgi:hypothetical protein
MKKWIWITVPAVAVGLGLVFLSGAAFAQTPGNSTAPSVNWTAMADYCRNLLTGNTTPAHNDMTGMRSYCQNATATGNITPGNMMGNAGMMDDMMDNGGMMGGSGGMMGNRSPGRGMMGW